MYEVKTRREIIHRRITIPYLITPRLPQETLQSEDLPVARDPKWNRPS